MIKKSLAIVVSHPIQHWVPVYKHISKSKLLKVKVFFVAENGAYEHFDAQFNRTIKWDVPLTEGYDHEFLSPGYVAKDFGLFAIDCGEINARLKKFDPDLVWINGYANFINWRVVFNSRRRYRVVFSSDSNLEDKRSSLIKSVKKLVVTSFLKKCDFFLSCGPKNKHYLQHYGVNASQVIDSTYPIDNEYFYNRRKHIRSEDIESLRKSLDLSQNQKIILFSGKLIPHKRPEDVVKALKLLKDLDITLLVMGSGILDSQLRSLATKLGVAERIRFLGFVNQSELALYFSISSLLVFPSSKEPFGAIASEVLQFGLPIVAAKNIGAVGASILPGKNALVYDYGDVEKLASCIRLLMTDEALYSEYSKCSLEISKQVDCSVVAMKLEQLLDSV